MSETAVAKENIPYNLSTSAKSEIKYKIQQHFREGAASPNHRTVSPYRQEMTSATSPARASPSNAGYARLPVQHQQTAHETEEDNQEEAENAEESSVYENGNVNEAAVQGMYASDGTEMTYARADNASNGNGYHDDDQELSPHEPDMTQTGAMSSEANMAAMTLTNEENLDPRLNGLPNEDAPSHIGVSRHTLVKAEENGDAMGYSTEGNVYTQLGGPAEAGRSDQLITIDSVYQQEHASHNEERGVSHSVLTAALRGGYTVHNMTYFTPTSQVTTAGTFDNAGHLLPQADVEAFFSDMEHGPMATSVTLSGMSFAGSGHYTTLTNSPGLALAHAYQATSEGGRLITLQPPSYSNAQGDYGLTPLYARQGVMPPSYLSNDGNSSSSPTPQGSSAWQVAHDSQYAVTASQQTLGSNKYVYSESGSASPHDLSLQDSQLSSPYAHNSSLASASSYTGYLNQDLSGGAGWYQNVTSPYSDVRPSGK